MEAFRIAIKKLDGIFLKKIASDYEVSPINSTIVMTAQAEMMQLGYIITEDLAKELIAREDESTRILTEIINILRNIKGADVPYEPFYPNFPEQVMEMSHLELFINAILHYWTVGDWKPQYDKLPRKFAFENTKFKRLDLVSEDEFSNLFTTLLSTNDSLSKEDNDIVEWYIDEYSVLKIPQEIPYKETLCILASKLLTRSYSKPAFLSFIKTSTDILRVATHISGGDISLAENTRFESLPRTTRRALIKKLEQVISEDDIQRHRNKWVKLFHSLHIGEYKKAKKCNAIAKKIRNNQKLPTVASKVERMIKDCKTISASNLLSNRPGEFARRLDKLLRDSSHADCAVIVDKFLGSVESISTRVLMQLYGHFGSRGIHGLKRVVFPKGNIQRAQLIPAQEKVIDRQIIAKITIGIEDILDERFSQLESLGNVYIDKRLSGCPLPAQMRSSSTGSDVVARGTHLPIGEKSTLRFFIYWVGFDIDLSATFHDDRFNMVGKVAYTNLKSSKYQAYHSGDVRNAPHGACEFIDINMTNASKHARYLAMNVLVYSGNNFSEHEKVYAGYMTRMHLQSNEIFDPKTVETKLDLTTNAKNCIPIIFDLHTREAIYTDLATSKNTEWGGNNVESNKATIEDVLNSITSFHNKPTLYDLFSLHTRARGKFTSDIDDADTIFNVEDITVEKIEKVLGKTDEDITVIKTPIKSIGPRDINTINSEYLK